VRFIPVRFTRLILTVLVVLCAVFSLQAKAFATDRIQYYYSMNPPSSWSNLFQRYQRIGNGSILWAQLGGSTTGSYFNLSAVASSGLYVVVQPSVTNSVGSIFQFLPDDVNTYGGPGSTALPTDATQIELQGQISAPTAAIGPLTAPGTTGQSINYLIECQVQTVDTTSQTITLVSPTGQQTLSTEPRDRKDIGVCQSKAGTAATTGSQTTPTVDSGWVPVSFVPVAYGATTISTTTPITTQLFNGFVQATSSGLPVWTGALPVAQGGTGSTTKNFVDLTTAQTVAGAKTFSSAPIVSTLTAGTCVQAGSGGTLVSTGSACGTTSGGITSLTGSGPISASTSGGSGSVGCATCVTGVTAGGNLTSSGGTTPDIELSTSPSFSGTVNATAYTGSTISLGGGGPQINIGSTSIASTAASFGGTVTFSGGASLIYGGGGSPMVVNSGSNYIALQGDNGSTGVSIANGSAGANISTFVAASSNEAYVSNTGAFVQISDRRKKKNIRPIKSGLADVMRLKPVRFEWRNNNASDLGVIAQDLMHVLPTLVKKQKDGFYTVQYNGLIPVLASAIQEQQHEIVDLKAEIKGLLLHASH
jgi:hypothetical protein